MLTVGFVFDWDGVLVDSSRHHEESWERLAKELGRSCNHEQFMAGFGMKNEVIISEILHWSENADEIKKISLRKEVLYREIVKEWGISPLAGVKEFIHQLDTLKAPRIIGSSTHLENIETCLEMMGMRKQFPLIVSAEDVSRGKPDPEVFLLCAQRLNLEAGQCIVFEDAVVGIQAAQAAKMKAVAITSTREASALSFADKVISNLGEIDPQSLPTQLSMGDTLPHET